jgi:hypothetical protein
VTATEILQRAQEKGDLIAPAANSIQSEVLEPETKRLIGIMDRKGLLPEIPQEILEADGEYEIEHTAPVNQLQRNGELVAIQRMMEALLPVVQLKPEEIHRLNIGEIAERYLDVQGGPPQVLRSEEEFQAILQQLAEQQQQAAMPEQAAVGAGALKDGAAALQMLQGGGGGAAA